MLPREILRQIRLLQLRARRAVQGLLGGEYHSVFKGTGVVFEEVREYQAGDDIRSIDWNVTARMGHPFIKRFIEDRELTLILAVDCSGSQLVGSRLQQKREVAAELASLLAFSALTNNDRVGLIQLTDRVEHFVPPRKGLQHVLRLIRDILFFQPRRPATSLAEGLDFINRLARRRAIVFLFSDFLDGGYEQAFKRTARRHDLVAVRISDPAEEELPAVGLLQLEDAETGRRLLVDTRKQAVRDAVRADARRRRAEIQLLTRQAGVDLIETSTAGKHLDALLTFFRLRERRLRRS